MDGTKRKNAQTPQKSSDHKTEDEEKSKEGNAQTNRAFSMVRTMRKLMKSKKKSGRTSSSSITKSSSSRHILVSSHTHARAHTKAGEKVDEKDLHAQPMVAHTGPVLTGNDKKIPKAGETMMVFTVFENDKGNQLAACRPEKECKLQWQSEEAERAAREDKQVHIPNEHIRTPLKKKEKSKDHKKSMESPDPSQHPTKKNEKAKTPLNQVSPGRPQRTPAKGGRTPARTPI